MLSYKTDKIVLISPRLHMKKLRVKGLNGLPRDTPLGSSRVQFQSQDMWLQRVSIFYATCPYCCLGLDYLNSIHD